MVPIIRFDVWHESWLKFALRSGDTDIAWVVVRFPCGPCISPIRSFVLERPRPLLRWGSLLVLTKIHAARNESIGVYANVNSFSTVVFIYLCIHVSFISMPLNLLMTFVHGSRFTLEIVRRSGRVRNSISSNFPRPKYVIPFRSM